MEHSRRTFLKMAGAAGIAVVAGKIHRAGRSAASAVDELYHQPGTSESDDILYTPPRWPIHARHPHIKRSP